MEPLREDKKADKKEKKDKKGEHKDKKADKKEKKDKKDEHKDKKDLEKRHHPAKDEKKEDKGKERDKQTAKERWEELPQNAKKELADEFALVARYKNKSARRAIKEYLKEQKSPTWHEFVSRVIEISHSELEEPGGTSSWERVAKKFASRVVLTSALFAFLLELLTENGRKRKDSEPTSTDGDGRRDPALEDQAEREYDQLNELRRAALKKVEDKCWQIN